MASLYSSLEEHTRQIRLLEILPRSSQQMWTETFDLINCALTVVSLTNPPAYTALSYVWGDASDIKRVVVNGTVVEITVNLEEALRHIAQEDRSVLIWADAICINQGDLSERSQQVQIMRNIYEIASTVLIWLGPGDDESDKIMDFFDDYGRRASETGILSLEPADIRNILSADTRAGLCGTKDALEAMVQGIGLDIPWLELNAFFSHAWFSRIWILQEVAVSRDGAAIIARGQKRLPFREFIATLCFLDYFKFHAGFHGWIYHKQGPNFSKFRAAMAGYEHRRTDRVGSFRRKYQQEGSRTRETLFTLLIRTHEVYTVVDTIQATDPRDRIYALLGMAKDEPGLSIKPDYTKSTAEVFTDAATAFLSCGHLDLLALNQFDKTESGLPSWVPDWTSYIQRPCGGYKADGCYQACGQKQASIAFQSLPREYNILTIKGCVVDTITRVGEPWLPTLLDWEEWTGSNSRCAAYFASIAALCAESDALGCDIYSHPLQRLEAHWRIPCANKARERNYAVCKPSASGAELLEGYTYIQKGKDPNALSDDHNQHVRAYRITMGDMFKRRPFISTKGYVGLVPSHSEPGDVICILYGCIVPFVLRKDGRGHRLVGEAYVHGIMDGEYVEKVHETSTFDIY